MKKLLYCVIVMIALTITNYSRAYSQTQFNALRGQSWTEFKSIGDHIQARVMCGNGGPATNQYMAQFKNTNDFAVTIEYSVSCGGSKEKVKYSLDANSVGEYRIVLPGTGTHCGNQGAEDIFISAKIIRR